MKDIKEIIKYAQNNSDKVFFTSDTHFGHANIIKFCNRPFSSVGEMNNTLVENWNKVVPKDGIVFHLGDFAFGGSALWTSIKAFLNGSIILVKGNHDFQNWRPAYDDLFEGVTTQIQLNMLEGPNIYLNHYPFLCFGGAYRGEHATWQLFGHVHSGPETMTGLDCQRLVHLFPTQYDVGVDNNNFTPVSYEQVSKIINNRQQSQLLTTK